MVRENFYFYLPEWSRIAFKWSTMVGENADCTFLEGLNLHLNCPPWLEKILTFTLLIWPKIAFKLSAMVGENFEFYFFQVV